MRDRNDYPFVSAKDPAAQGALEDLDRRMAAYYNRPEMAKYFEVAHSFNAQWTADMPHHVIALECQPGMNVVDLGCGSGHSYINLKDRQVRYVGLDVSREQIRHNRERYGEGPAFVAASLYESGLPDATFDLSFCTFVLEHIVWPHRFLREMVRITKPGGKVIVLCPHFRPAGRIPSLRYGKRVETLKQRVKRGRLLAALQHLYLRNVHYPRVLSRRFPRDRYPFLINTEPTCLAGAYYADNDAVYFTHRDEIVEELAGLGAVDVTQATARAHGMEEALSGVCAVVARRGS
jgi:ubiquinone/menaquinone biosynthesis C-methylase UbiE